MRLLLPIVISCLIVVVPSYAQVNGYEEDIQGISVIHVWGTDSEMGYALGYLDGDRAKYALEEKMIPDLGGPAGWQIFRDTFDQYFTVPQRIVDMADGIIEGFGDRPDSILYSDVLGRNFDTTDIYVCHSVFDLAAILYIDLDIACTSFSAWDSATESDPELLGAPVLVHNNDGGYDSVLIEVPSIITLDPSEGNQTVLYGWTLALGCTNGMNEHGLCLTENAGNHEDVTQFSPAFVPTDYANTLGLLEDDFNGSGSNDLEDLLAAVTNWNRSASMIVHTAGPRELSYLGEPSIVVEINNAEGHEFRYADNDSILAPDHLAATNHHRLLYPPVYCGRYSLLQDSISADPQMTLDRFWDFMGYCNQGGYTFMTICLIPETLMTGIAYGDYVEESWEKDPVWITWDQLFPPTGIESEVSCEGCAIASLSPNPSTGAFTVRFSVPLNAEVQLSVYDISGRLVERTTPQDYMAGSHLVEFEGFSTGVYICRMISEGNTESRSVVVLAP